MKQMNEMTKAELVSAIERKVRKASPMVKEGFLCELRWRNKLELKETLKHVKVTRSGDISLT